jgi:hypothetical protein
MHVIAAKAVCFLEALQPAFKDYARQVVANAQTLAPSWRRRAAHRVGRDGQPPDAGGPDAAGRDRQGCRHGARPGAHHREQERDSLRQAEAVRDLRHPAGHAGGDHARDEGEGNGADRRVDRPDRGRLPTRSCSSASRTRSSPSPRSSRCRTFGRGGGLRAGGRGGGRRWRRRWGRRESGRSRIGGGWFRRPAARRSRC